MTTLGAELVSTAYSKRSIFIVPEGTIRFCAEMALTTSAGESPLACSACRSISTMDLALLAAVGKGRLRAFDGGQLGADGVGGQVVQLLLVEALAGEAQLQHRHAGGVVLDDEGRRGARRQAAQLHLADGGHLGHGAADVHVRLEEDLDDADAVERLRLDVLDVVHRGGHAALAVEDDAVGHLLRREAGVAPDHRDHGNIDVGKDIRRHRAGC